MEILKGYVFRMYPNEEQKDLINKTITLPKLKEVSIRGYRNKNKLNWEVKSAVIRKEGSSWTFL